MPIKVLLADDDPDTQASIADVLETEGYDVFAVTNGHEAVEVAIEFLPDLILCDVVMPVMSGFEMLEQLQRDPQLASIPFIFLTALSEKNSLRLGMNMGADDYLTKPIDRQELLRAVSARIQKHRHLRQKIDFKLNALRRSITLSLPHELRTPLNGIIGMADILAEESELLTSAEIKEIGEDLRICGDRLQRLIQNFLLYAELESSTIQPSVADCSLTPIKELTTKVALKCARQASREGDLHMELIDAVVPIPAPRWQKIMEELLDNAFRYSVADQRVLIKTGFSGDQLVVEVRDCGRGMTPEQIANLGAYMQFDRRIYEQQGTGLGLTVAKRLVEFYGGVLTIDSTPVVGTSIFLQFQVMS